MESYLVVERMETKKWGQGVAGEVGGEGGYFAGGGWGGEGERKGGGMCAP
jgi:hypothetical protein